MLPKMNINGNKEKTALGKKETFKVSKRYPFCLVTDSVILQTEHVLEIFHKYSRKRMTLKLRSFAAQKF